MRSCSGCITRCDLGARRRWPPMRLRSAAVIWAGNERPTTRTGGEAMPLFRRRESEEAQRLRREADAIGDAVAHLLVMTRLRKDGRIDLAIQGGIDENRVFVALAGVHANWLSFAEMAWRGHEEKGRGFVLL